MFEFPKEILANVANYAGICTHCMIECTVDAFGRRSGETASVDAFGRRSGETASVDAFGRRSGETASVDAFGRRCKGCKIKICVECQINCQYCSQLYCKSCPVGRLITCHDCKLLCCKICYVKCPIFSIDVCKWCESEDLIRKRTLRCC